MSDDLDAIDPPEHATVTIGEGEQARRVVVRPIKVGKLPAFARALRPLGDEIQTIVAGEGINAGTLLRLVDTQLEHVLEALEAATGVPRAALDDAEVPQLLELVLAVMQANRNFLKGRAATALRMAAVISGAGATASSPSLAPAGASQT